MTVSPVHRLSEVIGSNATQDKREMKSSVMSWCCCNWRKIFAEFLSTTMLVLFGCMTTVPMPGSDSAIYSALGFGMIVMFNIQIFGHISGAYMNPAVTISSMMFGTTSISLGIAHIIVQCLGALAGYGILVGVIEMDLTAQAVCVTAPLPGQTALQSLGIETAITTALMLINCAMWDPVNKDKQESAAIKFGLTILGLSLVGGPLTGASMNPARSLGPAVWTSIWTDHWIYWVGPFLGSIIGTGIYMLIFLRKSKD